MDLQAAAHRLRDQLDQDTELTIARLRAGAMVRRHVRAALNSARVAGAVVEAYESKGLLVSTFAIRLEGTGRQLLGPVATLAALSKMSEED